MARATVAEYLRTVYEPECEWVDGEILERNWCEYEHAATQSALIGCFRLHHAAWGILVLPALRMQVGPTRYRVPDVCLLDRDAPYESIPTKPPLVCIEILSSEDRMARLLEKFEDYRRFGVPNIWLIDPAARNGFEWRPEGLIRTSTLTATTGPIRLDLEQLFNDLD